MEGDLIKITTPTQARFHLEKGEVVCFTAKDSRCYMFLEGDVLTIVIRGKGGLRRTYKAKHTGIDLILEDFPGFENSFVIEGGRMIEAPDTIFQRIKEYIAESKLP